MPLAGEAFERALGRRPTGGDGDFTKAALLIRDCIETETAAPRGFAVVLEATESLVASERFQVLAAALAPEPEAKHWHCGP